MTDLASKIAALPEWPDELAFSEPWTDKLALRDFKLRAALARLAMAREWIEEGSHDDGCRFHYDTICTCGRDALLKALEVPR